MRSMNCDVPGSTDPGSGSEVGGTQTGFFFLGGSVSTEEAWLAASCSLRLCREMLVFVCKTSRSVFSTASSHERDQCHERL